MSRTPIGYAPGAALVLLWFLNPGPAGGEPLVPDQAFLDREIPTLHVLADSLGPGPHSLTVTVEGVRRVLRERRESLLVLHRTTPLTSPSGVETQDLYDTEALEVVEAVISSGPAAEAVSPEPEAVALFDGALGPLPDLGKTPLPFMVMSLVGRVFDVADSLVAQGHMDLPATEAVVFQVTRVCLERWEEVRSDPFFDAAAQDVRHEAVIRRLRCPKDHGTYQLNNMKNQFREGGAIARLYYLQCQLCADPLLLEFPLSLVTRLNRMAERQKAANPATPPPSRSVEP